MGWNVVFRAPAALGCRFNTCRAYSGAYGLRAIDPDSRALPSRHEFAASLGPTAIGCRSRGDMIANWFFRSCVIQGSTVEVPSLSCLR
jgi:hypothetical protein